MSDQAKVITYNLADMIIQYQGYYCRVTLGTTSLWQEFRSLGALILKIPVCTYIDHTMRVLVDSNRYILHPRFWYVNS